MKKLIPKPTLDQIRRALKGELVKLIPGKKGYKIFLYPDGKYYRRFPVN